MGKDRRQRRHYLEDGHQKPRVHINGRKMDVEDDDHWDWRKALKEEVEQEEQEKQEELKEKDNNTSPAS